MEQGTLSDSKAMNHFTLESLRVTQVRWKGVPPPMLFDQFDASSCPITTLLTVASRQLSESKVERRPAI